MLTPAAQAEAFSECNMRSDGWSETFCAKTFGEVEDLFGRAKLGAT